MFNHNTISLTRQTTHDVGSCESGFSGTFEDGYRNDDNFPSVSGKKLVLNRLFSRHCVHCLVIK